MYCRRMDGLFVGFSRRRIYSKLEMKEEGPVAAVARLPQTISMLLLPPILINLVASCIGRISTCFTSNTTPTS